MKDQSYKQGFQDALIYAMEIFESRRDAMYARGWFRKVDVQRVVDILYAALRARDAMMEVGPRKMDLVFLRKGRYEFRMRKEKKKDDGKGNDPGVNL